MNSFLQLKNISKHFNTDKKIKVLKNLSYDFNKGKMYALMGPSGSGKSTLLNLISLIDRPSIGSKFAALNAGNIETIIVINIEQIDTSNIKYGFISEGIVLKK